MSLKLVKPNSEAANHECKAVLTGIIAGGTHENETVPIVYLEFTIIDSEKPQEKIYAKFSLLFHKGSQLRTFLEKWRGKEFTYKEAESFCLECLVGKSCTIEIEERVSVRGNPYKIVKSAKNAVINKELTQNLKFVQFDFDEFFDVKTLYSLPDFVTYSIRNSKEFLVLCSSQESVLLADDEVPF